MSSDDKENQRVSVDDIVRAPIEQPATEHLPSDVDPLTGRDGKLNQHLGRVGLFIGGGPEKAGNIAYIVIVAAFLVLLLASGAGYWTSSDKLAAVFDKLVTGCISLITGALGYLFGSSRESQ